MPRLLELYCCQGGSAKGYADAGFDVVGVDTAPQPRFPFEFHRACALDVLASVARYGHWEGHIFDAIHASPPCQAHSKAQRLRGNEHPELIGPTRDLLLKTRLPYVIENVEDARAHLRNPVTLCGAMFGLSTYRHRLFETNWPLTAPLHPHHVVKQTKMGRPVPAGEFMQVVGNFSGAALGRQVMQMPWASREGLREAVPPAYTEHVGRQLLEACTCGYAGPDGFGNFDQLEDDDCPRHGSAPVSSENHRPLEDQ